MNFNIFGSFQKNEYFWGYEDFVDIFWRSSQKWTGFGGPFYVFFLRSMYRMRIFFWVPKISNSFWGMPDIQDIFFCKQYMLGPCLRMKKQEMSQTRDECPQRNWSSIRHI